MNSRTLGEMKKARRRFRRQARFRIITQRNPDYNPATEKCQPTF